VDLTVQPPVVTGDVTVPSEATEAPPAPEVPVAAGPEAPAREPEVEDRPVEVPSPVDLGLTPIFEPEPELDTPVAPSARDVHRNGHGAGVGAIAPDQGLLPPPPPPPPTQPAPPAPAAPAAPAAENGHGLPTLPTRVRPEPAGPAGDAPAPAMTPTATGATAGGVAPPLPTRHPQPVAPDSPTTAGGLTRRVPKAPQPANQLTPNAPVAATQRTPEEVRLMLSRYRSGLRRGRVDESPEGSEES
jgi:hypothetical protein